MVEHIKSMKAKGEKITMLTAYDYPTAKALDEAGVNIILVGDSVANVVLGLESTTDVGMEEMIHHAKAARRGVKKALLVGDMPYASYQENSERAVDNAKRFIDEAGCDAVKLEWFGNCIEIAQNIVKAGIPVMGHVGLTPQTADSLGGMKVQGKEAQAAKNIIQHAKDLEQVGCFSIVLECIPMQLADIITKSLSIPTIGIGAGVSCDGQVLVVHDLLGLFDRYTPKFVKQYADLNQMIKQSVEDYCTDVRNNKFPGDQQSFTMSDEELKKITGES